MNPIVAPPSDVRCLLGDKVKTIGSTPYEVKRAGTTPTPTDVDSDGVVYSVKMADCIYRVLLVSGDSKAATDEEILDVCPSLVNLVATMEQQFLTIDDLMNEEAVNLFMDGAMGQDVSSWGAWNQYEFFPLSACNSMNPMFFDPLWVICSVLCDPSSHEMLRLLPQDHGESFTDQNQCQKSINRISVLDTAYNQENDGYGSAPIVLESQVGPICISATADIQVLMCLLAKMTINLSIHIGTSIAAYDDPPLLMHHLEYQSFPSVKYKQIQYDGITSSFEMSTDYVATSMRSENQPSSTRESFVDSSMHSVITTLTQDVDTPAFDDIQGCGTVQYNRFPYSNNVTFQVLDQENNPSLRFLLRHDGSTMNTDLSSSHLILENVTSEELAVVSDDRWVTTVPDDLSMSSLPVDLMIDGLSAWNQGADLTSAHGER